MNKVYYFSRKKLNFVEIKHFHYKLATLVTIFVVVISLILSGGYSYIFSLVNSQRDITSLKNTNKILRTKLEGLTKQYKVISNGLDSLVNSNSDLRVAAGLPPVPDDVRMLGYGGGLYDDKPVLFIKDPDELEAAVKFADDLERKFDFEKSNYLEITNKLEENKKLYSSLPAIKPCSGTIGIHGFGMRMHPILHRIMMHEGIDIVANVGTPVHAAGKGRVIFTGLKGGLGLAVEIDHGFGYRTIYGHLSKILVKKGRKVSRGDVIAKTGNTGLSTGPHLHYEVEHNGVRQDPMKFIFEGTDLFD